MSARLQKLEYALSILRLCIGEKGVWADPTRYRNQCWTRDFGIAIAPLLLRLGEHEIVRTHLSNLSARQRPDGQIPIVFLDDETQWVRDKERKSVEQKRPSFMLERYRQGTLWNLTPGTRDSELLYLISMYLYALSTGDKELLLAFRSEMRKALRYIEWNVMRDGLFYGCDWRDTMHEELGDKPLLTNNCLMYFAYRLMGASGAKRAETLRRKIHRASFLDCDYPGSERFDPLGAAFSVLSGVASKRHYRALLTGFKGVDSPHGVTIKCRHNPQNAREAAVINRTNGVVVWPFVVGFTILALRKMGETEFADEQLAKLTRLEGFREWYDPRTGGGYGAQEQLWSAALYARVTLRW